MLIYSYNFHSRSARALAAELDARLIRHEGSRFVGRPRKVVINWGASVLPDQVVRCTVLNSGPRVAFMTDKLKFFKLINKTCRVPKWTEDRDEASRWLDAGADICARTVLNGHSARGLVLVKPGGRLPDAPLFTKYVPKMSEFRVHCVGDAVIDVQRKAARRDFEGEVNWQIRNLDGGFVYVRDQVKAPKDVLDQALKAFKKTKLDFGAVDVIYNMQGKHAYVLECNTAPGMEGRTVEIYAESLRRLVQEKYEHQR